MHRLITIHILLVLLAGCSEQSKVPIALSAVTAAHSAEPHLAVGANGEVVMSWLEQDEEIASLNFAVLGNRDWQAARKLASGSDWFVNWADFPSVVPISPTLMAAHWLVKSTGATYSYDVVIATSQDQGATWNEPTIVHRDGTATEHGFVSLYAHADGVGAIWLDGRNMVADGHAGDDHGSGGMTLRAALVDSDGDISAEHVIDALVCDCCQTDVAITQQGAVAVYRNRTPEEIRDIYVARQIDGKWRAGVPVSDDGWEIAGCPVNGPAITASGSTVAVAWFTGADNKARTQFAWSDDGGEHFSSSIDIDVNKPVGRVDVELLGDDTAAVSWLSTGADGRGEIKVRRVSSDGKLGTPLLLATTSTSRMSGFPQMVRRGEQLVFAWTDTSNDHTTVKSALLNISALQLPDNP